MIKLLLVEDDKNLSYIVQSGLQDIIGGYEVITACNGEEGLEAWKAHRPDIIISDIDMPVMDGFEWCGAYGQPTWIPPSFSLPHLPLPRMSGKDMISASIIT